MPDTGDLISVSIFIASTTAITSPSEIESPSETKTFKTLPGRAALIGVPSPDSTALASIPSFTLKSYSLPLTVAFPPSRATAYFYH